MRKTMLAMLLFWPLVMHAQIFYPRSDTFTFDKTSAIISWDGSDPANPPYPNEMGSVQLGYQSGIDIPWQLGSVNGTSGYLNNGYLVPCDPLVWGQKTWIMGDGTQEGDTYTVPAATTCPYFTGEYGSAGNSSNTYDSFNVIVTYVRHFHIYCRYGVCHRSYIDAMSGGTGTAVQQVTN